MSVNLQAKWDEIYRHQTAVPIAAQVLREHLFLLPKQGRALDLACGAGANALLLAEAGLKVDAWDISAVALQFLQQQAAIRELDIHVHQANISAAILPVDCYDVIVISRFLDRTLCNAIMVALKAAGLLFYQTFTCNKLDPQGPSRPDYLLASNELLRLFAPLSLVFYQEHARIGNLQYGDRNEACFIGQKPSAEQITI
ncbi:methyltransferase domain-containing protein [Methylomonas paludis]|uniref:Methyltransferase domain-containing protein n=1 Tax=Methylomonas paludis TaxID=1173101 RepID=A0A975MMW5_9GAMM|nr:methyltransferase domain-containing protein [Methylomonas paludis]QWF70816.1 methyltransferase domain-containing protein [Methylomonas paludis]